FDRFVGVDWSGARGRDYSGIAVAECGSGTDAPVLVKAPTRRWRRVDFVEWLAAQVTRPGRMLVRVDCAVALPAAAGNGLLGDGYAAAGLWQHIDATCGDAEDYYGGAFALHADHRDLFWHGGPRPPGFAEHHRACEHACREARLGAPE